MANLFTAWSPALANVNEATNVTIGITLYFDAAGTVSAIRFYAPTTVGAGTFEGTLWQITADDSPAETGTGTLLGSASFGTLTPGAWNTAILSSPISVSTGVAYVVAVRTSEGRYTATGGFFNSAGLSNAGINSPQTGTNPVGIGALDNGKFITNITGYPNKTFNGNGYGVDVDYTVAAGDEEAAGALTLPTFTLAATTNVSATGAAALTIPHVTLAGTGAASAAGASALTLPALTLAGAGMASDAGAGALLLPPLTLAGVAETAPVAEGALLLPSLTLAAATQVVANDSGGSWESIYLAINEARAQHKRNEQRRRHPVECPKDGWPLEERDGVLHCKFGGHIVRTY